MAADSGFGVFWAGPATPARAGGVIPLKGCGTGGFDLEDGAVAIARAGDYLALMTVRAPGGDDAPAAFGLWLDDAPLILDGGGGRSSLAVFGARERARLRLRLGGGIAPAEICPRALVTLALVRLDTAPAQAAQPPHRAAKARGSD